MAQKYQGKNIRSSRPAREGDAGWRKGADQVTVVLDDGSEKTVERTEVTGGDQPEQQQPPR